MTRNVAQLLRGGAIFVALLLSLSLGLGTGGLRPLAFADDEDDVDTLNMTAYELQQEIEARQAAYAAAREEADAATNAIAENQERIEELERKIPEQRERSSAAARDFYKFQQQSAGVVDLLLCSDTFYDFLAELEYINRVAEASTDEMARLGQLQAEISAAQVDLRDSLAQAEARAENARMAMAAAQEAQAEVQRRIEEEARLQAEIAANAAKLAEEPRENDTGAAEGGAAEGGAAETPTAESGEPEAAATEETLSDEETYVESWGKRIDAYLSGSPLAGQGETFARAAYAYGVDPRFSPAISFTESSKGQYCFKSHNAWGWGSSSWDSWEEAIYAHVAGLAKGYGGQISEAAAKKYCPPNWKTWYDRTLAQMEMI